MAYAMGALFLMEGLMSNIAFAEVAWASHYTVIL